MDKGVVDPLHEQSKSEFTSTVLGFINKFLMEDDDSEEDYNMFQHHEHEGSSTVLGSINQFLMEEDFEKEYTQFQDSFALQLTEKSFHDVIAHTPLPPPPPPTAVTAITTTLPSSIQHEYQQNYNFVDSPNFSDYSLSSDSTSSFELDPIIDSYNYNYNPFLLPNTPPFSPNNFVSQSNSTIFPSFNNALSHEVLQTENFEEEHFLNVSQNGSEQVYVDDSGELSELFDKVLVLGTKFTKGPLQNTSFQQNEELSNRFYGSRRQRSYEEVVDLRTLLMLCAQSISCNDISNANQLLNQIKKHSSPTGDGTQRLAHFFGNALEARLAGTGSHVYRALSSKKKSAADMVKAYQVYSSACPFEKLAIMFSNDAILNVAKETESLHIIDFGVGYGFKWLGFIYRLSKRSGGPPKLRITGIDLPNSLERVNETGLRLSSYCKRFNVPFEYNGIAKNWESIKVQDFKIRKNEFVAVTCVFKFENLPDETVVSENPRGAVLDLIKKANPNIFIHSIVNGGYDAPFFVTRFKEAVFYYSALFDMLDNNNVEREDPVRLMFEGDVWGKDIMNVIACEGCDRVERPETYMHWHSRHMGNGFRSLKLDKQIINKLKCKLRDDAYNSDFLFEVKENWMLQGWKGRILFGSSCWIPT
ncbi:putative transcription factor GRAS family [Medicago truncatula]|uniref:Putative transcription factor GRAS family n=1 Tax=Medicago truncatula TaxID=3880 RepID=A0A396JHA8_MEDTR|nr:scarecrow-like protein 33 [Medicago truncatula]RHN76101.1 putative transcription factor GRAS family [Medicago truncatula]